MPRDEPDAKYDSQRKLTVVDDDRVIIAPSHHGGGGTYLVLDLSKTYKTADDLKLGREVISLK